MYVLSLTLDRSHTTMATELRSRGPVIVLSSRGSMRSTMLAKCFLGILNSGMCAVVMGVLVFLSASGDRLGGAS